MAKVIYKPNRRVIYLGNNKIKVITAAVQGADAVAPAIYTDHIANHNNPHQVGLLQLSVPANCAGKWLRISDDGTSVIVVDPPLTAVPTFPAPADEKVKADPADPATGYLNAKVGGVLYVDETTHLLKLKGATGDTVAASYYYGTNASGVLGFWPLPDLPTPIADWDKEEEWLDTGAVTFFKGA